MLNEVKHLHCQIDIIHLFAECDDSTFKTEARDRITPRKETP